MPSHVVTLKGKYSFVLLWDCDNTKNTEPQKHTQESTYTMEINREELDSSVIQHDDKLDVQNDLSVEASGKYLDIVDVSVKNDTKIGVATSTLTTDTISRAKSTNYKEEHKVTWEFTVGAGAHLKFYQVHYSLPGVSNLANAYIQMNGDQSPEPSDFEVAYEIQDDDHLLPQGQYYIQSWHGAYLCGRGGGEGAKVELDDHNPDRWTLLYVPGTKKVGLLSSQGTLLRALPGGEGSGVDMQINRSNWSAQPWEQWTIVNAQKGRYGLLSAHGLLLRAMSDSHVDQQINRSNWDVQPWEQFTFIPAAQFVP